MSSNLTDQADLVYLTGRLLVYSDRWGIENQGKKQITRPSTYLLIGSKKTLQILVICLKGDHLDIGSTIALVPENPLSKECMRMGKTWLQFSVVPVAV